MSIYTYTNIYTYVLPFYASGSTRSLPPITHKHKHNIYTHMFPSSTPPVQPGPFLRKHTNTNTNIYTHMFSPSTPPVQPGPFLRKHTNTYIIISYQYAGYVKYHNFVSNGNKQLQKLKQMILHHT